MLFRRPGILVTCLGCLLVALASSAQQDQQNKGFSCLVVVNKNSELTALSQKQVISMFLGRAQFLPSGVRVQTFDFPVDSALRAKFYQRLTGKNIADIDAYWARLRYSGRASPPLALQNAQAIIEKLNQHKAGLAYLPWEFESKLAANGLKAVLILHLR